jgi:hypothetical protein
MLSGARLKGCATQLVNPLNAVSLSCGHTGPHGRNGRLFRYWPRRGLPMAPVARLPAAACHTGRDRADTEHAEFYGPVMPVPGTVLPGCLLTRPGARLPVKLSWTLLCTPVCWRGRGCAPLPAPDRSAGPAAPEAVAPEPAARAPAARGPARPEPPVRLAAPASRRRPASVKGGNSRTCPERPIYAFQPDAAPQSPRRAVITDPFNVRPGRPQCTCIAQFSYHGFDGVIR